MSILMSLFISPDTYIGYACHQHPRPLSDNRGGILWTPLYFKSNFPAYRPLDEGF